ncbi:MAG: PilZ domain-containing protein [Burkholderiales bacterium]|nr:PilZ domain-containing protein [Burkholderiales bacterium]
MSNERRQFLRVSFDAPAFLTTPMARHQVEVLDLSFKGALVRLAAPAEIRVGMFSQLSIPLAKLEAHIAMSTEVAHISGNDIGLMCRSIDLDSMTHLRRLIELNLNDPALLDREFKALMLS